MGLFLATEGLALGNTSNDPKTAINSEDNSEIALDAASAEIHHTEDNSVKTTKSQESKSNTSKVDSLSNFNSSCKFNFLFYFIYKVKYDENGEIESGGLNFEF